MITVVVAAAAGGTTPGAGIMVLALRELYRHVEAARASGRVVTVTLSYIEVYCENIRDLLAGDAEDSDYLDLREVSGGHEWWS